MGNQLSHEQPPVNDNGRAVLYICTPEGRKVNDQDCSCSCEKGELFYKPEGGGALAAGAAIPEELSRTSITQHEFSDGVDQINVQAKRLVPGGKLQSVALGVGGLILAVGLVLWLLTSNGVLCDDESVKDYWRHECVKMDDCATRELVSLDSLFPECRSECLSNMTQDELLATANPDGGQCMPCPENDAGEQTRGCQCVPLNDIRTSTCEYDDQRSGCMDFVKTRVCDDELQPTFVVGIVLFVIGHIVMIGAYWFGGARQKSVSTNLAAICDTLSSRSQTGTSWKYVQFPQNQPKFRCIVIDGVAKDHTVGIHP